MGFVACMMSCVYDDKILHSIAATIIDFFEIALCASVPSGMQFFNR